MSVNAPMKVTCPDCSAEVSVEVCLSVNGGRHAHFRDAILGATYQRYECDSCGSTFRLDPEFTYFDATRSQWILVRPVVELDDWGDLEQAAYVIFDKAYGAGTPPAAQELGASLQIRVVFGWSALREKLVCADAGLDDAVVELCKLALLRDAGGPLSDDVELRLLAVHGDTLVLAWQDAVTDALVETLRVPKALYDGIAADDAGWADLADRLREGPFVDVNRLLVAESATSTDSD